MYFEIICLYLSVISLSTSYSCSSHFSPKASLCSQLSAPWFSVFRFQRFSPVNITDASAKSSERSIAIMPDPSYRERLDQQRLESIRKMLRALPRSCADFIRSLLSTTSTLTRLAYTIDLGTFLTSP